MLNSNRNLRISETDRSRIGLPLVAMANFCAHGDLHLRNLVLIEGRPILFDALEFDETLGTCDALYDVAFLIMDLCHRKLRRQACRVLDAWLREAKGQEDSSLAALPLFLSVRAAIRAMVLLQTDAARGTQGASATEISPSSPVLVRVSPLPGTSYVCRCRVRPGSASCRKAPADFHC